MVARHERDDGVVTVPCDLPHTQVGRTDLGRVAAGEIDQEQPPPRIARPANDRVGRGLGAADGSRAPIEPVRARVRGQDQQPGAVARPRHALAGPDERGGEDRLTTGRGDRVGKAVTGPQPVRQVRKPPGVDHVHSGGAPQPE